MAVKTVEAKLILEGEDRASRVIAQVEKAYRGMAKAFGDVSAANRATEAIGRHTRALGSQQKALAQVEEVRRRSSARASADYSHRVAAARVAEVTKALGAAAAAQKAYDGTKVKSAAEAQRHSEAVRKLTEQQKAAQRELRATQSALRSHDAALAHAKTAMREYGVPVRNLEERERALRKSIDETTAAIRRQERAEREAAAADARTAALTERRIARRAARREAIGTMASGAAMVAAYRGREIGRDAVAAVKSFDEAVRYQHIAGGVSEQKQRDVMVPSAKRIAQETRFTNTDIIEAQTRVAQSLPMKDADVKADVAASITEQARHYAVIMKSDMTGAAEAIRSFLQTTQKDISTAEKAVKEASRATNVVVAMSKLGGLSDEDAQQFVKYAYPTATAAGLKDTTVAALGSVARRGGLRGDEAGVFVRAAASKLVAPTAKGLDALTVAGIDYNKFTTMPGGMSVKNLESLSKRRFGKGFNDDQRSRLRELLEDSETVSNRDEFTKEVSAIVAESFPQKKSGGTKAQDSQKIAKMVGDFHKLSVESVNVEGLLAEILQNPKMTLALKNAFFTDKHGGKASIVGAQFEQLKSDRDTIAMAAEDPTFSSEKSKYMIAGVAGSLENLAGSWENFVLQIGASNERLISRLSDSAGKALDVFAKLDPATQQAVSLGAGAAATVGGSYATYRLAGALFGGGKLNASAGALTGSATALNASAVALEAAALKLGGGAAASTATTAATTAAATGAGSALARWAPMLGMSGFAVAVPWAAAEGNEQTRRQLAGGLERRKAEREGRDLPYLKADAEKARAELADFDKRSAEIGSDENLVPVLMSLKSRKAIVEAKLREIEGRIARLSTFDAGLDALSDLSLPGAIKKAIPIPEARDHGAAVGKAAGDGIAEGVKDRTPEILDQGKAIREGLENIFRDPLSIPMNFTPGGGSGGGGLMRASYGGSATDVVRRVGGGIDLGAAGGAMSGPRGDAARDPTVRGLSAGRVTPLPIAEGPGEGHAASRAERAAYIREAARRRGIDPDIALRVAQSEGFNKRIGDQGRSFGDFQLFTGGGLGNEAEAAGIDVRDPNKWREQADFALDHAKKSGWGKFHGAARVGIGKWQGIETTGRELSGHVVEMQERLAGIRRGAVSSEVRRQLDYAASETGVRAEVFSGGQPSVGRRTGSRRHDHGGAADVRLSVEDGKGGRRFLSMEDEGDRAVMETFIRKTVKAGASGVGAGPGYMGPHGIHIGGGKPLAWGAGGRARNAPDWVRRALREGIEDRSRPDARPQAPIALPRAEPPKMPEPIPALPSGHSDMQRAADRMNEAANRFETMRFNAMLNVELSGSGRDSARVKGMKAKGDGPVRADMGVTMPHVRSPRVV